MLVILWITSVASLPLVRVNPTKFSQQEQKILPPDPIPVASPSHHSKSIQEYSELSEIALSKGILEENCYVHFHCEGYSLEYARLLTTALIYTQITSSFL